jgi:WD40 repeat protein
VAAKELTHALRSDTERAVTGVVGNCVRLWDTATGLCLREFVGHSQRVWGLAWSPDQRLVLSGSWDNTARLWNADSSACLRVLEGHTDFVRATAFSSDGQRAVTAAAYFAMLRN